MSHPRVCVIGAGVIGLSTAVNLIENVSGASVTLISEKFSPDTTGDGSAGFLKPHHLKNTPFHDISKWFGITQEYLMKLYNSAEASDVGVLVQDAYMLYTHPETVPEYSGLYLSFREMNQTQIERMFGLGYTQGWAISTPMVECWKYLPYLLQKFKAKGGKVIQRKIESLQELYDDYDVVVNCTGIGAKQLVGDKDLVPARGQLIRVEAPWMKFSVIKDDLYHIIPGARDVVVGGTFQEGNTNLEPNEFDRQQIWQQGCAMVPSLKKAKVLRNWAGLRPTRSAVRLERETVRHGNKTVHVVHNYGHSGSGVTLHWGCARDATELVIQGLSTLPQSRL